MIKFLDKLGEWLLVAIKFVFIPRSIRRHLQQEAVTALSDSVVKNPATREALIAEAVSLHRQNQDVLSELDDTSRKKLKSMAHSMFSTPYMRKKTITRSANRDG